MPAPTRSQLQLTFFTEPETHRFGQFLASKLTHGDTLLLSGEIGAGKSVLARSIIQSRMATVGKIEDVPSPTFTIVQVYETGDTEIWHADLYRLGDASEAIELGLDEAFTNQVCIIEWPDRLGDLAPTSALHIELSANTQTEARTLNLSWVDSRWANILNSFDV